MKQSSSTENILVLESSEDLEMNSEWKFFMLSVSQALVVLSNSFVWLLFCSGADILSYSLHLNCFGFSVSSVTCICFADSNCNEMV